MSNEMQTQQGGELMKPDYLNEIDKKDWGTDNLAQYVTPPFLKIVQKQASAPFDQYENGTIMAVPQNIELFRPGQEFHITPIFQYTEFVITNPYTLKASLPFIRERSTDPNGEIAKRARNFNDRMMICPEAPADKQNNDKYMCCYYEHINFIVVIHESETLGGLPIVMTFRSGSFKQGKNFASLVKMRQGPMPACVFKCCSTKLVQGGEENYVFSISNPTDNAPWLTEEEFLKTNELHKEFKKLSEENRLQASYESDAAGDGTSPETPEM